MTAPDFKAEAEELLGALDWPPAAVKSYTPLVQRYLARDAEIHAALVATPDPAWYGPAVRLLAVLPGTGALSARLDEWRTERAGAALPGEERGVSAGEGVYDKPEAHGLTVIGEVNDPDACYSFNTFVAWRHEDGRLFWASDSGCSCPTPFEDCVDLESLSTGTVDDLTTDLLAWVEEVSEYSAKGTREEATADAHGLLRKVRG